MNFTRPLILASKSPRRAALLKEAGFDFDVQTKDIEEIYPSTLLPTQVAEYLAEKKALAFKSEITNEIILSADTIVLLKDKILEKPKNKQNARQILSLLSGQTHQVMTGVCLLSKEKKVSFSDTTSVAFKPLSQNEIDHYLITFQPYDKAGSYGIQEWIGMIGVTSITGSYFTVMGLPTHRVYEELIRF